MAGRGRPKKRDDEQTATIRVRRDLAAMLGWITRIRSLDTADVLDPVVRPHVTAQYAAIYPAILAIKAAEDAARAATGQAAGDPLPVVPGLTDKPAEPEPKPKKLKGKKP